MKQYIWKRLIQILEIKNTITEMKTAVDTLGSHLVGVEEKIRGLADRSEEIIHNAAQ